MLLEQRARDGILAGAVTLLFRRWRRAQVVAGRHYRTTAGLLVVESVTVVPLRAITPADARSAGYPSAAALVRDLRGSTGDPVFRLKVRLSDGPDPRSLLAAQDTLTAEERAELERRLARLEARRTPWVAETLDVIARSPGVSARELAASLGRERDDFKLDVRKLKNLGLTLSLEVGYELSPRGCAYLRGQE